MAKAAVACGADGLIIEVHPRPEEALSDGPQSLKPSKFAQLMRELLPVANAVGRAL
jgi:3-deoxy-7-phosphoheptulonate synthase